MEMSKEEEYEKMINCLNEKIIEIQKENSRVHEEYEKKILKLKQKNFERKNLLKDKDIANVSLYINFRIYLKKKLIECRKRIKN